MVSYSVLSGSHGFLEFLLDSSLSLLVGESVVSKPLLLGVRKVFTLGDDLSNWLVGLLLNLSIWVLIDGSVDLLVDILAGLSLVGGEALLPLRELGLELGWSLLLELIHVVGNMNTEDVISVDLGVEVILGLLFLTSGLTSLVDDLLDLTSVETWESLGSVWDVDTSITGTLKSSEKSGTGSGSGSSNIEVSLEWSLILAVVLNVEVLTIDLVVNGVHGIELDLLQQSSGNEETGAISSGVVGKTGGQTMMLEFSRIGSAHNSISGHGGVDDLGNNSSVGSSNNKSVFLGVILILVLAS